MVQQVGQTPQSQANPAGAGQQIDAATRGGDAAMMYFYLETPMHAGSGRGIGAIDLPIQRERTTGLPMLHASGLKGPLRAAAEKRWGRDSPNVASIFGRVVGDTGGGGDTGAFGGALSPGDVRLLLFPVRSLYGVFAWATSNLLLERLVRDLQMAGLGSALQLRADQQNRTIDALIPGQPGHDAAGSGLAWVAPTTELSSADGAIVLEEFSYNARRSEAVAFIGRWLADNAFPDGPEYAFWKRRLPSCLVILNDEDLRDFTNWSTEIAVRIRLDSDTKTVMPGALWTEESLPSESVMYSPLFTMDTHTASVGDGGQRGAPVKMSARDVLSRLRELAPARIKLGGDETTGKGIVNMKIAVA